jgi:hypothetical protein
MEKPIHFALFTNFKSKNDTEQRHLTITNFVPHMVLYEETNLVKTFNKENISLELTAVMGRREDDGRTTFLLMYCFQV